LIRDELKTQTELRIASDQQVAVLEAKLEAMTERAVRGEARAETAELRVRARFTNEV